MKATARALSLLETGRIFIGQRLGPKTLPAVSPRRILILGYAAIGDCIFFLPVLEELRRRWPDAKITWLADCRPLIDELVPATGLVDEIWYRDWENPDPRGAADIQRRIREGNFDLALLSLSSPMHDFQGAIRDIPLRVGHCRAFGDFPPGWSGPRRAWWSLRRGMVTGELARRAVLNRKAWIAPGSEHAVWRNLRLLEALGIPKPEPARPRLPARPADLSGLDPAKKRIAVHLGPPGNQYFKMWRPERFGRLCALLSEAVSAEFVIVGAADESASLEAARRACAPLRLHSRLGKCSLLETFGLLANCDLFIGNDTGLAKAAMALGIPTVTVYGPTDPAELGILWEPDKHLEVRTGISCSPCIRLGMAKAADLDYSNCGHHDCLEKLAPETVFAAIQAKYLRCLT